MNYMKQVAQMLGVELEEEFKVGCSYCPYVTYKITKDGMFYWSGEKYGWQSTDSGLTEVLSGKTEIIKKTILDAVEKEYLSAVIKPFRDRTISIIKYDYYTYEYIAIKVRNINEYVVTMPFPAFKKGTMYKGIETGKAYSLEELEL